MPSNINFSSLQLSTDTSSLKILLQGSGSFVIPSASGSIGSSVIPHNYGSDFLTFQVGVDTGVSPTIIPWQSNDGRVLLWATIDSTNLTIYGQHSGAGHPNRTIGYYYRIFIP